MIRPTTMKNPSGEPFDPRRQRLPSSRWIPLALLALFFVPFVMGATHTAWHAACFPQHGTFHRSWRVGVLSDRSNRAARWGAGETVDRQLHRVALEADAEVVPLARASSSDLQNVASKNTMLTGTVEGVVMYKADPQRPWRYGRYYVKDRKKGFLAEAVVALKGPGLKEPASANSPATAVIDQKDFRFIPETTAIRAGDRVKFTNQDAELHNVNTPDGLYPFNIVVPIGGALFETFGRAGGTRRPIRLGCVFHGSMRGWIFVFDHPHYLVTASDGRFRMQDVPAGKYRLEMVHPAGGLRWTKKIEVKPSATQTIEIVVSPDDKERAT